MIRAPLGSMAYWNKWTDFNDDYFEEMLQRIQEPPADPLYRPQYIFKIVLNRLEQILRRYSRGDDVRTLIIHFDQVLDMWEESERLGNAVGYAELYPRRRSWRLNLDYYIICFWLVGFALIFDVSDSQWRRLLALVGNEGEDELLDRIIATRQSDRKIGTELCHPKPYKRLLTAIKAPEKKRAQALATFLCRWYPELDRKGTRQTPAFYLKPYWYEFGSVNPTGGMYFGRWCVEAVAAVKVFGLDDSLCLGYHHYPGDFLRPDGPTTHPELCDVPEYHEPPPPTSLMAKAIGGLRKLIQRKI